MREVYEGELVDLWARLERLKLGIGGWIVTGATMPAEEAIAENVDGRVRDLIDTAIKVKARIVELSPPARPAAGVERDVVGSPLSPVTGVPVVDLPSLIPVVVDEPNLGRQLRERILRQRQYPAHREDDSRRRSA